MSNYKLDREELIRRRLRYLIQTEFNGVKPFHQHLYGSSPDTRHLESFNWFLKRGVMNWEFMSLICEKTKVGNIPLGRLLDIDISNEELFSD